MPKPKFCIWQACKDKICSCIQEKTFDLPLGTTHAWFQVPSTILFHEVVAQPESIAVAESYEIRYTAHSSIYSLKLSSCFDCPSSLNFPNFSPFAEANSLNTFLTSLINSLTLCVFILTSLLYLVSHYLRTIFLKLPLQISMIKLNLSGSFRCFSGF